MQLIKCTAKLRKEMGLKNADLAKTVPEVGILGAWHANLIYVNRRKNVFFVNDKTLYSFIVINLSRKEIKNLDAIFTAHLPPALAFEGFSEELIGKIMQEYASIQFSKTDNRSVIGSMNSIAFYYKYNLQRESKDTLLEINREANRVPMIALNYAFPIEELKQYLETEN